MFVTKKKLIQITEPSSLDRFIYINDSDPALMGSVVANFPQDFGAVCDKHGVQLLLSGHDHSYQRTWRIGNVDRQRSDTGTDRRLTRV